MTLLTLKMQTELVFRNQYSQLFSLEKEGNLLMDKIFYLLESVLDPSGLEGRFIFLEKNQQFNAKLVTERKNKL